MSSALPACWVSVKWTCIWATPIYGLSMLYAAAQCRSLAALPGSGGMGKTQRGDVALQLQTPTQHVVGAFVTGNTMREGRGQFAMQEWLLGICVQMLTVVAMEKGTRCVDSGMSQKHGMADLKLPALACSTQGQGQCTGKE